MNGRITIRISGRRVVSSSSEIRNQTIGEESGSEVLAEDRGLEKQGDLQNRFSSPQEMEMCCLVSGALCELVRWCPMFGFKHKEIS